MIRTESTFENLLYASPTQMLDRPGATPHCGTRMQLFFLARLSRTKGSCGVYEISTRSFPAPITFRIISKPRRPGKAPHTMSESSSNFVKTDPWISFDKVAGGFGHRVRSFNRSREFRNDAGGNRRRVRVG